MSMDVRVFGRQKDGLEVDCCTLKNKNGMSAEFLTYGCRVAKLYVPGKNRKSENVVLGHDTVAEYEAPSDVLGAVIGRYANRIGGAQFHIGEKVYHLAKNEGPNILHSAPVGWQNCVWRIKCSNNDDDAPSVTFAYHSPDGESGFPGNVDAEVAYTLTTDNALMIEYRARTDAETPLSLTNHTYFNLTGDSSKSVLSQELQIFADSVTETDGGLIPTGKLLPVAGTALDFRKPKAVGQDIRSQLPSIRACGGYDHNFALGASKGSRKAAELYDEASGRRMLVFTDMPGVQLYTANSFGPGAKASGGVPLKPHRAVCLETQYYPDSVNRPEFPYENLKPEEPFHSTTIYKFIVE